jgi:tetratricopeptide (TPR) repeat protein
MRNVAEIQNLAENGDLSGAHQALDGLLEMGPRNVEALKLRARLFEVAGKFQQEAKIWEQVAKIDREDSDLEQYIVRRQSEDRENFYFTDALPGGGKRFIAFPRKMVRAASIGLVGCIVFLGMARLSQVYPILNHPVIMLSAFAALVISPWLAILISYAKSLRFVSVSRQGIEIATRFKVHKFEWSDVDQIYLAQDDRHDTYQLSILIMGRNADQPCFEMDFNENTTPIRARSYFVRELIASWGEPNYVARKTVNTDGRRTIKA